MVMVPTVTVPAFEFKFNLVVCPLPKGIANEYKIIIIYFSRGGVDSM